MPSPMYSAGWCGLRPVVASIGFLLSGAVAASSQSVGVSEISGGLTTAFVQGDYDVSYYSGLVGSVGIRLTPTVSLVGAASAEYNSDRFNDSFRYFTLVGGPKFSGTRGRARPYGQLAMGLFRDRTIFRGPAPLSYANNFFVFQPGGGVDLRLTDRFDLRLGGDWFVTQPWYGAAWLSRHVRIVTGVTFRP